MALETPEQAVEDRETLRVAVQDGEMGQVDEFGRNVEAALRRIRQRRGLIAEQIRGAALDPPGHVGWLHVVEHQHARRRPPAVEIDVAVEGYEMH